MKEDDNNSIVNFHEKIIERFIEKRRPPKEIRDMLDIGFTFEDQIINIFEIRPKWDDIEKKITIPIAKSRFIKSKSIWKIYWKRANGNWDPYGPQKEVRDLSEFLKIVDEDKHGCFWG